ncbi:unnamed protein product [marine sediment metagenome]|uniref:Uncharacterized protein n=1 Tax=marine sediment metagenome TaxID=412755 RepID=X1UD02_9ZZZZ
MPGQTTIDIIADFAHRWVTEVIWPYIGGVVDTSIAKLEGEGFTHQEARFWIEALTILQLYRMNYYMGGVWHRYEVTEIPVLSEAQLESLYQQGIGIDMPRGEEYWEGF